jgi:spore coat polysaccharide biosynthesis protein SpsF
VALTLAFLQARMRSTRLAGKALLRIQGKSILQRSIERLRAADGLDDVVVLTTHHDEDDAIVKEAGMLGAPVFRGPDLDVLARFRQAADLFRPDIIVRATADNPLIDIGTTGRIVRRVIADNLDYCVEVDLPVGAATEAITRPALETVDRLGGLEHHREHVTIYIKEHRDEFRTGFADPPAALRRPDVWITVDTPADFAFVECLIKRIPEGCSPVPLEEYLELLRMNTVPR